VTLPQDLPGRGNIKKEQSAIRLYEIGPRMTLQLVKIEAGVCDGEVLHHQFVHKSLKESKLLNKRIKEKKKLKLKRKREQEENVLRKQQDKEMKRKEERKRQGLDDDDDDDAEWYRKEVGVAPDSELLLGHKKLPKKRKLSEMDDSDVRPSFKKKRSIHEKPRIISSKKNYKTHSSSKTITKKIYTGKVFRKKSSKN
jgi:ribosome biogenesis protein SSF1/2